MHAVKMWGKEMNKRIQELAQEIYGSEVTAQEIKFAELIAKECARVSENYPALRRSSESYTVESMPFSIGEAIREHFGVEQ